MKGLYAINEVEAVLCVNCFSVALYGTSSHPNNVGRVDERTAFVDKLWTLKDILIVFKKIKVRNSLFVMPLGYGQICNGDGHLVGIGYAQVSCMSGNYW